jgi:uncharacterized protein
MAVDVQAIVHEYYPPGEVLTELLLDHSARVRDKALAVAQRLSALKPDMAFIAEAAFLHDIGIGQTSAPVIHCHGSQPYVCHGIIGRRMLETHGLPRHALVCERHVGTGITVEEIAHRNLPLPARDMRPRSLEEQIICYADKFFSKSNGGKPLALEAILTGLTRYGPEKAQTFLAWHRRFESKSRQA